MNLHILNWCRYLLFFVLIFLCQIFFRNYFLYAFLILLILFPIASLLILTAVRKKISLNLIVPDQLEKNTESEVCIEVKNDSFFPILSCRVLCSFVHLYYRENAQTLSFYFGLRARGVSSVSFPFSGTYAGILAFEDVSITITDYSGLFFFRIPFSVTSDIFVVPESKTLTLDTESVGGAGLTELVEQDIKGNDSTEIIDTRDYLPGDKPQRIHWKLSGKLEKLIVKEYGSISSNDLLVLLDLTDLNQGQKTSGKNDSSAPSCLDEVFSLYRGTMEHLLIHNRPFTLGFYSPDADDIIFTEITDKEAGIQALRQVFYLPLCKKPGICYERCSQILEHFKEFLYILSVGDPKISSSVPEGKILCTSMMNEKPLAQIRDIHLDS